jgi:hypothetical protein
MERQLPRAPLLASHSTATAAAVGLRGGFPDVFGVGLRGVPLSSSGAHRLAEHRACQQIRATLYVRCGSIRAISAVIPTRLRRTARHNDQNDELTELGIGHRLLHSVA